MSRRALTIAVGGAIGAAVRWALLELWPPGAVPWTVLAVNLVGSFVLGLATSDLVDVERLDELGRDVHHGLVVGFCGGLTTMSTLAVEIAHLTRDAEPAKAALTLVLSLLSAAAAVAAGLALGRRRPEVAG